MLARLPLAGALTRTGRHCGTCAAPIPGSHAGLEGAGAALGAVAGLVGEGVADACFLAALSWLLLAAAATDQRTGFIPRRLSVGLGLLGITHTVGMFCLGGFDNLARQLSWDIGSGEWGEVANTLLVALGDPHLGSALGPLAMVAALTPVLLIAACWAWLPRFFGRRDSFRHPYDAVGGGDIWLIGGASFCLSPTALLIGMSAALLAGRIVAAARGRGQGHMMRLAPWLAAGLYAAALYLRLT